MSEESVEVATTDAAGTPVEGAPRGTSSRPWGKWSGYGAIVAIAIGAWVWGPDIAFYFSFQKLVLAYAEDPGARDMLWALPTDSSECGPSTWKLHEKDGNSFRAPAGEISGLEIKGPQTMLKVDGHDLFVQRFAPGFLRALLTKELEASGGADFEIPADHVVLESVIRSTPDSFEFGVPTRERTIYAAHLLVRMLLFEPLEVRRSHFVRRTGEAGCVYLVEYKSGAYRLLTVDDKGGLAISFDSSVPDSWVASPGEWLR